MSLRCVSGTRTLACVILNGTRGSEDVMKLSILVEGYPGLSIEAQGLIKEEGPRVREEKMGPWTQRWKG